MAKVKYFSSTPPSNLLHGALLFYILSGFTSLLNFIFYPVISRFVTTDQYGEIQFIVSIFTQLSIGFVILNLLAIIIGIKITNHQKQNYAMSSLTILATCFVFTLTLMGSAILYAFKDTLSISGVLPIVGLLFGLLVSVPFNIAVGSLQGGDRFIASGILTTSGAFLKLLISIVFILLGWGVAGAVFGIGVGLLLTLAFLPLAYKGAPYFNFTLTRKEPLIKSIKLIKKTAIAATFSLTLLSVLSIIDTLVSRIYLSPLEAGQYASVATLAKIILAVTSPIMWLAIPPAVRHNTKLVLKYVILTLLISIAATSCFIIAPSFFTHTIIGVDPKEFITLVPLASAGMALFSVAFITLMATICEGRLRDVSAILTLATTLFLAVFIVFSSTSGPLIASLYGQVIAAACIITGLIPKLLPANKSDTH